MGSGSVRRQIAPHEIIPPVPRRQPVSEKGRAGEVLVEEVILGVLDAVSWLFRLLHDEADHQTSAEDHDAQTLEALNLIRKGFADLGAANPELAYKTVMDVLGGIRS
jgi:serine/threonine-protein kinase 24/25/MST4